MNRLLGFALVALIAATAVAACGSAGRRGAGGTVAAQTHTTPSPPASPPPTGDVAVRAKQALVQLPDMPSGWVEQVRAAARVDCDGFEPFAGAVVVVRSRRLTDRQLGVQERIALFRTVPAATRAQRKLESARAANCLRRELRRHVTEEAGSVATPATLMRAEAISATSHARRYVSTAVGNYGKVVGYVDAVHTRVGRALAALAIISGQEPPDAQLYDHVVGIVMHRLDALRDG